MLQTMTDSTIGALGGIIAIHCIICAFNPVRRLAYLLHTMFLFSALCMVLANQPDPAFWYILAACLSTPLVAIIATMRGIAGR